VATGGRLTMLLTTFGEDGPKHPTTETTICGIVWLECKMSHHGGHKQSHEGVPQKPYSLSQCAESQRRVVSEVYSSDRRCPHMLSMEKLQWWCINKKRQILTRIDVFSSSS
jgi:hypothetical protein